MPSHSKLFMIRVESDVNFTASDLKAGLAGFTSQLDPDDFFYQQIKPENIMVVDITCLEPEMRDRVTYQEVKK